MITMTVEEFQEFWFNSYGRKLSKKQAKIEMAGIEREAEYKKRRRDAERYRID